MSSVPLPWCTSKSTIATLLSPWRSSAYLAAMATLLKKQKPMALSRQAWCPGGRTAQKAFSSSPASTASVASSAAPAATKAASQVWALIIVSGSRLVCVGPPAAMSSRSASPKPRKAATCMRPWASSISVNEAGLASRLCSAMSTPLISKRSSMAPKRSGHSGWPAPISCFQQVGWVK